MRHLPDWITAYEQYVENTESPKQFHKWVALSSIAAALRKKINLKLGRINICPNMYTVLVGPPGSRKSQAINFGLDIVSEIPGIITSSDATTPEAFIQDLEKSQQDDVLPLTGEFFRHCSLSVISRELEIFLGQKANNMKMIMFLTDVFDSPDRPWKYRTKHGTSNIIPSVFVNLLAATTPDSLASSLPAGAIGGGLTSRMMLIYGDKKNRKVPIPRIGKDIQMLKEILISDLCEIAKLVGSYEFSPEGEAFWIKWYEDYNDSDPYRKCPDSVFDGWYERKPIHILKIAQICAASISNELLITPEILIRAISYVESAELTMPGTFASIGMSTISAELEIVCKVLRDKPVITERELLLRVIRHVDSSKFDTIMTTLVRSGQVKRAYPKITDGTIVYYWQKEKQVSNGT